MTRRIQQIKQEIESLEETVSELAQEMENLYDKYFDLLGQSTQKQLILASYQLCTQVYPEPFLSLSLSQRQKLQQNLREIGKQFKIGLEENLAQSEESQEQQNLQILEEMLKNFPLDQEATLKKTDIKAEDLAPKATTQPSDALPQPEIQLPENPEEEIELERVYFIKEELNQQEEVELPNPEYLVRWRRRVEKIIRQTLDNTSRKANKSLHEAEILPSRLPAKIIDVAIQAEELGSRGNKFSNMANVLNLAIETEKEQKAKPAIAAQISLLRLRLSEIEFADPVLTAQRQKIREFLKKVEKLRQQYKIKQREYAVAEAEAAWRSSWYEDS